MLSQLMTWAPKWPFALLIIYSRVHFLPRFGAVFSEPLLRLIRFPDQTIIGKTGEGDDK